jgi:hypothetical protein
MTRGVINHASYELAPNIVTSKSRQGFPPVFKYIE